MQAMQQDDTELRKAMQALQQDNTELCKAMQVLQQDYTELRKAMQALQQDNTELRKAMQEQQSEAMNTRKDVNALLALEEVIECEKRLDQQEGRLDEHERRLKQAENADIANSQTRLERSFEHLNDWATMFSMNMGNVVAAVSNGLYYFVKFVPDKSAAPTEVLKRIDNAATELHRGSLVRHLRPASTPGRVTAALSRRRLQEGRRGPLEHDGIDHSD